MSRSAENHAVFDDLLLHQRNNPSSTRAPHASLLALALSSRRSGPHIHTPLHTHDFCRTLAVWRALPARPPWRCDLCVFITLLISHTRHTQKDLSVASISIGMCLEEQVSDVHLLCRLCTAHAPKRAVFASFVGQGRACLSTKWSPGSMKRLRA